MNVEGAQLARQRGRRATPGEPRFVAGSVGPLNVTLSLSPRVDDPSYRARHLRPGPRRVRGADRGAARGRRRPAAVETIFDTLNAKAAIVAAQRGGAGAAALDLVHRRRPQRPHAVGPDGRGVLDLDRARRARSIVGVNCSLGADARCGPSSRSSARVAPTYVVVLSERGPAERVRRLRRAAATTRAAARASSRATGLVNIVGGCCGTTPEHIRAIADAVDGLPPRHVPERDAARPRFSGLEPFAIDAGHRLRDGRRAHERHRLGALPPADRGGRLPAARRGRARAGARRREHARREHGRRPARRPSRR